MGRDWCHHRYMGYLMDSCLTGKGQVARACAIALGRTGAVEVVANRMGEAYAMRYVEAVVAPSALYATKMAPVFRTAASSAATELGRVHTILLAEAAGLGRLGGNRGHLGITGVPLPALRREGLISETRELPWDLAVDRAILRTRAGMQRAHMRPGRPSLTGVVFEGGGCHRSINLGDPM